MKIETINIKQASKDDVDALCVIESACFNTPWTRIGFADFFENECSLCLIASIDGCVVGYVGMYIIDDVCEITNIATLPEYRKRKVATSLMNELIDICKARSVRRVILEVRASNLTAISFYKKIGFYEVGIRKGYYKNPKEDAVLMDCKTDGENL